MATNGRPRIEIDFNQFEYLCGIQCTLKEIAGFFKCSEDTIDRRCKENYDETFSEVFERYSQEGKISLRREQFKLAKKGDRGMLIWLGKNYLGQRDSFEDDGLKNKDGAPLELNIVSEKLEIKEKELEQSGL